MNRWACTDDLKNYFRIKDLLGGLTEPLKRQLRENIGISMSEGGQTVPTALNYTSLKALMLLGSLVTGARYLITDFQSIYKNNEGTICGTDESAYPSERYNLLVTAISPDKLDPRIIISEHPDWTVEYDPTPEVLSQTVVTKGKITYLKDGNNNSAFYDFKNIRYTRMYNGTLRAFYTFSAISDGVIIDNSNDDSVHDNEFCLNTYNNVFIGPTYFNRFEPQCYGNTFYKGCHDTCLYWESINNTFNEPVIQLRGTIANRTIPVGEDILSDSTTKIIHNVDGSIVMLYFDNDTFAQQITIIPENYSKLSVTGTIYNS